MKRRIVRTLIVLAGAVGLVLLPACDFLRDEFWTLDRPPPEPIHGPADDV